MNKVTRLKMCNWKLYRYCKMRQKKKFLRYFCWFRSMYAKLYLYLRYNKKLCALFEILDYFMYLKKYLSVNSNWIVCVYMCILVGVSSYAPCSWSTDCGSYCWAPRPTCRLPPPGSRKRNILSWTGHSNLRKQVPL